MNASIWTSSNVQERSDFGLAGGPSFHVPFFFPVLMLQAPRPCVLRKGGHDAADGIGSCGSFEFIEPKRFTVGSRHPPLRRAQGRLFATYAKDGASIIEVTSAIQGLASGREFRPPSGFESTLTAKSDSTDSITAHPCKKRKDGAPSVGMAQAKIVNGGATRQFLKSTSRSARTRVFSS
jgi:hypothetical protein